MLRPQLYPFRTRLIDRLRGYDRHRFVADLAAGFTVGLVTLPLALAFAVASGVRPEQGLVTAVVAGLLVAVLGGSSVQIGGPAGAFIVVAFGMVQRHGLTDLLVATALAGVLLFVMGVLRLGTLVRYVPVQVTGGFMNGIAVLIGLLQLKDLLGLDMPPAAPGLVSQVDGLARHLGSFNPSACAIGLATFAGLALWPRLWSRGPMALPSGVAAGRLAGVGARIPGPLVALVTMTAVATWLELPVETLGSRFGGIARSLPALALPPLTWEGVQQLVIPALAIALLCAVESLTGARVADHLTRLPRHDPDQELMAQGLANMVVPVLGGLPATGTIARTVTNVRAGATSPVAGIVHAATLAVVSVAAAPLAAYVPLSALAGILLFVAWHMGEWHEFSPTELRRFTLGHRVVLLGTFFLTVVFDLMVAVQVGLVTTCVFFIWRMSLLFRAQRISGTPKGVTLVRLHGALFFGAVGKIEALGERLPSGTRHLVLGLYRLIWIDASGIDALVQLYRQLQREGIQLWLADLRDEPLAMAKRAGLVALVGADHVRTTSAECVEAAAQEVDAATA